VDDADNHWQMIKRDMGNLGIIGATNAIEQKDILATIDEYIKFRNTAKNFKYSEEILENMRFILNIKSSSTAEINSTYVRAMSGKLLAETNLRLFTRMGVTPKYSAALNYEQARNLMNFGKNYAANYLAYRLYGIVWK